MDHSLFFSFILSDLFVKSDNLNEVKMKVIEKRLTGILEEQVLEKLNIKNYKQLKVLLKCLIIRFLNSLIFTDILFYKEMDWTGGNDVSIEGFFKYYENLGRRDGQSLRLQKEQGFIVTIPKYLKSDNVLERQA